MKARTFFLITLLCAALAGLQSVNANTITVTNTNDSGAGSLRQALVDVVDGDTIDFAVTSTITLTSGQLVVNKNVTISGPGANNLSVDGNHLSRVFYISAGETVTISGLTITNGADTVGGGIYNDQAVLTVNDSTISSNSASYGGGGVHNVNGTLTVNNSTISGNSARSNGGGVNSNGTLTINNSTFSGNSAPQGGGVLNVYGTLTVNNSTFSGNSAVGIGGGAYNLNGTLTVNNSTFRGNSASSGGGVLNYGIFAGYTATLTVNNSTFSGNSASGAGGGVYNLGTGGSATLAINNSTFSGNSAQNFGGGVESSRFTQGATTLTVNNSTFSGNSSTQNFGGGISCRGTATLTIGNTILNAGSSGQNIYGNGTITSLGYNLSSDDASPFLNQAGDLNSTDPMLGPLQDNGGPTFTHQVFCGSPAIDAGNPSFTPPPDYDQRGLGFNRVVNGRIDIGAFEVQTPPVCPEPQGYWKNNPDSWPVNSLTLGSQTYTETELLSILRSHVRSDASLILAYQLIAAKLNIANCANGTPVTTTITDADAVLSLYSGKLPYRVRPNSMNGQRMVSDGAVLGNYNNGLLTSGCTPTPTPTPTP